VPHNGPTVNTRGFRGSKASIPAGTALVKSQVAIPLPPMYFLRIASSIVSIRLASIGQIHEESLAVRDVHFSLRE
jgi:hypothetical protein